jgi:hypothetical protein
LQMYEAFVVTLIKHDSEMLEWDERKATTRGKRKENLETLSWISNARQNCMRNCMYHNVNNLVEHHSMYSPFAETKQLT